MISVSETVETVLFMRPLRTGDRGPPAGPVGLPVRVGHTLSLVFGRLAIGACDGGVSVSIVESFRTFYLRLYIIFHCSFFIFASKMGQGLLQMNVLTDRCLEWCLLTERCSS